MMVDIDTSYNNLTALAIASANCGRRPNVDIRALRELYEENINSPRMLSQITDIKSLIQILEKRSALSPLNIDALDVIYSALNLSPKHLEKHCSLISSQEICLFTKEYNSVDIPDPPHAENSCYKRYKNHVHTIPSQTNYDRQGALSSRIIKTICSQIGHSWKTLARYLNSVQEHTIDQIEEDPRFASNEERAKKMLDEYQRNEDPLDLQVKLLRALKLSKRMDIHDQVQKLFLRQV